MTPSTYIQERNEQWIKERTDAISEMFDNKYADGIYPTSKFFERIDAFHTETAQGIVKLMKEMIESKKYNPDNTRFVQEFNQALDEILSALTQ